MKCTHCGQEFTGTFCPNCGTNANAQGSASEEFRPAMAAGNIQPRSIALWVILSIFTCGICAFVWMAKLTNEVNELSGETNGTSGGMVVLLSIVTFSIYMYYWGYKQGEKLDRVRAARGLNTSNLPVLYLVLMIFISIVGLALMQNEVNESLN